MLELVYIVSNINKALAFEWVAEHLDSSKFHLSFILIHDKEDTDMKHFLDRKNIPNYFICYTSKINLLSAFIHCTRLLWRIKPNVVHTHLRDADIIGQISGLILQINKRITTRHSSTYNHQYFPKSVKWDKLVNWLATDIVSISEATKYTLTELENVKKEKIIDIHHGFDLSYFTSLDKLKILELQLKYKSQNHYPVVGVVARYIEWKGIEFIIRAFKELLVTFPNAKLMLANACGPNFDYIQSELRDIPTQSYIEIPFENDISSLYHLFDLYIHVPIDKNIEAFGQTYVESMATGVSGIFTLSGIGNDICHHEENCLVVDYKNSEEIYEAMLRLLQDENLQKTLIENAKKTSLKFGLKPFIVKLENLYYT